MESHWEASTLAVPPEYARLRCALRASSGREHRASGSPSPPLEERDGERRPFTLFGAEVCADMPADSLTNASGAVAENDDLLSLSLSSKGGEGESDVCTLKPTSLRPSLRLIINHGPGSCSASTASSGWASWQRVSPLRGSC